MKSKDYDVSIGIMGGLLLQLIVVFSTGLFTLEQRAMFQDAIPVTATLKFTEEAQDMSTRAFSNAMSIEMYKMNYAYGATASFAYQTLNDSQIRKCMAHSSFALQIHKVIMIFNHYSVQVSS